MINIYKTTGSELAAIDDPAKNTWIHMTDPSAAEIHQLAEAIDVDADILRFPLGPESISNVKKEDDVLRILIRIPYHRGEQANIPYVTVPLGIAVTRNRVVTVCRQDLDIFRDLDETHRADLSTEKPYRLVLHMLWSIANAYLRFLNDINETVDKLEDELHRALQNREVLEILRYQKSLVYFRTGLEINELMLERLQRAEWMTLERNDAELLDDAVTENQEARKMVEISSDLLSQMMDAFASIISNNLNVILKFLASITIILIIPQIIGTFFGMNLGLPMEDHPYAFSIVVGVSVLATLIVTWIFWKKNWL